MFIFVSANDSYSLGIDASWYVKMKSKINVVSEVVSRDKTSGVIDLYSDETFELYEYDSGRTYTGTYTIEDSGKKQKLYFQLDSNGMDEMRNMLIDWVYELAYDGGIDVSDLSLEFTKIKITKAIISKKTGKPKSTKIKITGNLTGYKNGKFISREVKYQSIIKFKSIY
jgi:hypothetical protein